MVSWDSFRYPSSGAVSSPASAPLVVAPSTPHAYRTAYLSHMRPILSTLHTQHTPCRTAVPYARVRVTRPPRPACGAGGRGAVVCAARRCRPRRLRRCRRRRRLHRRRRRHRCRRRSRLRRSGCQKPAPRPLNAEPRGRRARATAEPPLMPIACARALRVPRRCLGCSRRCLRFVRLCATKNLCTLQRKLVSNRKSKEWSMLGSGKHFAIGKKEARRVWHLRVDCACCTQEAVAPP